MVILAHINAFAEHIAQNEGTLIVPTVLDHPKRITDLSSLNLIRHVKLLQVLVGPSLTGFLNRTLAQPQRKLT